MFYFFNTLNQSLILIRFTVIVPKKNNTPSGAPVINATTEEAVSSCLVVKGVNFMNLDELIKFKEALGREKDFKDIELIKRL